MTIFVQFFLQLIYIFCSYQLFFSPFQVPILFWGKLYFYVSLNKIPFAVFFLVSPQISILLIFFSLPEFFYLFPPGSINCNFFLSLFFTVITCIYFNLFLQVRSSKSGTILVVIPFILSNLNKCFFLVREPHNCCELQFWYNHCRHKFSHNTFI